MFRYLSLAVAAFAASSQALNLSVASDGGNQTGSLHYGLMFEDINFSGDGGLYAELIRNRAFQGSAGFPSNLSAWSSVGGAKLALENLTDPLSSALPTSVNVAFSESEVESVGLSNTGWWGMDVQVQPYKGSFWVKGAYNGSFKASLVSAITNDTFGSVSIPAKQLSSGWTQYNYTLTPGVAAPNSNNSFLLTFDKSGASDGSLDFNLISLFPPTYKNRPNGMRKDLMEALAGVHASFLRFPGGNNLEGNDPPYLWYWNETIGPLEDRPGRPGTWGYHNTDGLGLIEYLHWCEDLDLEPVLAVWGGYYLDGTAVPQDELEPWVQFALDELEFLMGGANTTWGARRIALGYPEPFTIRHVEIGNEDFGSAAASYTAYRFQMFYDAIIAAYPDMDIIASMTDISAPGNASLDYHEYSRPDQYVSQVGYFDHWDRQHGVMVGEYAIVQPNVQGKTGVDWSEAKAPFAFWIGTVSEAVYLIGTERNSDVVWGTCYAPLLQNLNQNQWTPDLISFTADPSQDVMSTSWHLVSLFSENRLTETLPTAGGDFGPAYWVAGLNADTGSHILKMAVYNSTAAVPFNVSFAGVSAGAKAELNVLTAPDAYSYNDIGSDVVKKSTTTVTASDNGVFSFELPDLSVGVLEVGGSNATTAGPKAGWKKGGSVPTGYRKVVF